jgi:hypothetical protein
MARESHEYVVAHVEKLILDFRILRIYQKMTHHYREGRDDAIRALFSLSALMRPDQLGDFFNKWITSHGQDLDYLWRVHRFVVEGGKQSVDKDRWEQVKDVEDLGAALVDPDIMFHRFNRYARQLAVDSLMKGPDIREMYEYFPHVQVKSKFGGCMPNFTYDGMKD